MNTITYPVNWETVKINLIEEISQGITELKNFKEEVSSVFQMIGSFLYQTSRELDAFDELIRPYIQYFYVTSNEEHDSFISDVVKPSQEEMINAINQAVSIMKNDSVVNATVEKSIKKALEIKPIIENLLEMIEEIETYSWNAMLVSTKAGIHGQALATISSQVSTLSSSANEIAKKCKQILENLNEKYNKFERICNRIDIINENYLTTMSIKSAVIFKEMVNELEKLSSSVSDIMGFAFSIQSIIENLLSQIQREDVVRQDLEKAISISEVFAEVDKVKSEFCGLYNFKDVSIINELLLDVLKRKYNNIYFNLQQLIDGTEDCCNKIKSVINEFLMRFYRNGDSQWAEFYDGRKFDSICEMLEMMKEEFVVYIEEIINNKRELYQLSKSIGNLIATFRVLFEEIIKISRKFEVINMLSKIELAKHVDLKNSIGGSLLHVSNLPSKIKKMTESAIHLHGSIMTTISGALDEYSANFIIGEEVLTKCIATMKKISVKLFESQKYYRDISEKIGSTGMALLAFLETRTEECIHGKQMMDKLYHYLSVVEQLNPRSSDELLKDTELQKHLKSVYEKLESWNSCNDNRGYVFTSVLLDILGNGGNKKVMLF